MSAPLDPFSNIAARDWLGRSLLSGKAQRFRHVLLLLGDGPFEARELGRFLHKYELNVYLRDLRVEEDILGRHEDPWEHVGSAAGFFVVVGAENFRTTSVLSLLQSEYCLPSQSTNPFCGMFRYWMSRNTCDGVRFHRCHALADIPFISQEMLLALLFGHVEVPDQLTEPWLSHARNHPALSAIRKIKQNDRDELFRWPTTHAAPGSATLTGEQWPSIGLLRHMGYTVGTNGGTPQARQRILATVFELAELPQLESPDYVRQWGVKQSAARLKKMAESIAAFCRNAKRNPQRPTEAISDWETDLAWLKRTFYDGKFDRNFEWPRTD